MRNIFYAAFVAFCVVIIYVGFMKPKPRMKQDVKAEAPSAPAQTESPIRELPAQPPSSGPEPRSTSENDPMPLDAAALTRNTIYFAIFTYNSTLLENLMKRLESIRERILTDTDLISFGFSDRMSVYIYKDKEEYKKKTKRPEWSSGFAFKDALYIYEQENPDIILAHEMTHLLLRRFTGAESIHKIPLWVNEGLATYEESLYYPQGTGPSKEIRENLKNGRHIPAQEFFSMKPSGEKDKDRVSLWYWQARSCVNFLIEKKGRRKFYNFLNFLKEGKSVEQALSEATWSELKTLSELEAAWLSDFKSTP